MIRLMMAVVLLAAGTCALAQTADVIQLSADDAKLAKSLYDQKAAVEKQIADLQAKIKTVYTMETCESLARVDTNGHLDEHACTKPAWYGGFTYSRDFKYIVPLTPTLTTTYCGSWTNTPYVTGTMPTIAN